jgi:hypothetical protein
MASTMKIGSPQSQALGQLGSDWIADTTPAVGSWSMIYCVESCTFTTLTSDNLPGSQPETAVMRGTLNTIVLLPGMFIRGAFTAITLATGKVIAYV